MHVEPSPRRRCRRVSSSAACSSAPPRPLTLKEMPAINTDAVLADIKKLSSDEFEGREPGSKGEELTVEYLIEQFKAAALEPGNPDGTWIRKCRSSASRRPAQSPLVVKKGGQSLHVQAARRRRRVQPARDGRRSPSKDSDSSSSATACRRRSSTGTTSRAWTSRARRSSCSSTIRRCQIRPTRARSTRRRSAARR